VKPSLRKRQRGVTLVVVLMLLLVITLLGLAAMRGTVMQERMAGNSVARAEAFQFAEAALREVESDLASAGARPTMPTSGCSAGLCAMPVDGAASAWEATNFWTSTGSGYGTADVQVSPAIVRYVVEDMGDGQAASGECTTGIDVSADECTASGTPVRNYRITVFSQTGNGSEVLLQTTYQLP
jgi:type IV pilus assembly protein PilX